MGLLDRKHLLSKEQLQIVKVDLGKDENGEELFVFVKQMTAQDRDKFESILFEEIKDDEGNFKELEYRRENYRSKLAVSTICDETGKLILRPEDFPILAENMSAVRIECIINEAQKINNITKKDREALEKNSEPGQADSSNFASAGN